jgi:murein DD-endopeptidase MepM/ murein hydrolase activator NlpD
VTVTPALEKETRGGSGGGHTSIRDPQPAIRNRTMSRDERRMTFIVVPSGGNDLGTRSFEISYRRLRVAGLVVLALLVTWAGMAASWWYMAAQAARVPGLKEQIVVLEGERERVTQLAEALGRLERQYEQVRSMLGADRGQDDASGLWLPPIGASTGEPAADSLHASLPRAWPLTQRGFVTREHLAAVPGEHPGLDIAIAEGSYVRAAGAGIVVAAGEDTVYGKFVRLRHGDGFESMYAHASQVFVSVDESVEQHEVIALSGNTGRSTAPHLHFEIRKDGEPIDPRSMIELP